MKFAIVFGAALGLVLLGACTPEKPAESPASLLKARATNDLKCPVLEVRTKTVDDRTRIAWGCGRTATYVESCEVCAEDGYTTPVGFGVQHVHTEGQRCNCTWMLNSGVHEE